MIIPQESFAPKKRIPYMQNKYYRQLGLTLISLFILVQTANGQGNEEAVFDEILSLYKQYDIVHIGERHWSLTDYDFRVALVRYPAFAEVVDDIVIESGNYLYQDMLDDYILKLKDIPDEELCKVWRNTVISNGVWDATIYKEFYHVVREVNENLPPEKRIRLIAAEPPIDWSKTNSGEEASVFIGSRCTHTPEVVISEVVNKGRKALIIYGGAHFYRSGGMFNPPSGLLMHLENLMTGKVFSIQPLSGDDESSHNFQKEAGVDKLPYFLQVKDSRLASMLGRLFFGDAESTLGKFTDGILFFGLKPDTFAEYDSVAANDSVYQEELKRRQLLRNKCMDMTEP
jgi:hypothetical protein